MPGIDELVYVDDVDFIVASGTGVDLKNSEGNIWNVGANPKRDEDGSEKSEDETWKRTKKLGSILGTNQDIKHRKNLARLAMNKMTPIWNSQLPQEKKVSLCNAIYCIAGMGGQQNHL